VATDDHDRNISSDCKSSQKDQSHGQVVISIWREELVAGELLETENDEPETPKE